MQLAKQVQVAMNIRDLAPMTGFKISHLFRIQYLLQPLMNQNLASDSAKSKAEEGLLYTAFQRLKVPLNYYAEARSLLVNLKTALGYQKVGKGLQCDYSGAEAI